MAKTFFYIVPGATPSMYFRNYSSLRASAKAVDNINSFCSLSLSLSRSLFSFLGETQHGIENSYQEKPLLKLLSYMVQDDIKGNYKLSIILIIMICEQQQKTVIHNAHY
jgi:hypothetical protein